MARDGDRSTSKSQAPSKPNPFEDSIEGDRDGLKRNPPWKARRLVLRDDSPSPPNSPSPSDSPNSPPPKKHKSYSTGASSSRASKGKAPASEPILQIEPPPELQADEQMALAIPPAPYPFSEPLRFENEEHRARFMRIGEGKKTILATSYPNCDLLGDLGIREEVRDKLEECGLLFFFEEDPGSYETVMIEFLCTLEAERENGMVTYWKFILGGREFVVARRELREWMHLSPPYSGVTRYNDHDRAKFWQKISGRNEWFVSSYNATKIADPAWKVIHHLIARGINSRGGKARALTNPDIDLMMGIDQQHRLDWVSILADRFEEYVEEGSRNTAIGGGSLISLIAMNCGFSFDHPECPKPSKKILDVRAMRLSKFLIPDTLLWAHDDQPHLERVIERARKNKAAFKARHKRYPLTPSPPSSPSPSDPPTSVPPTSEGIPPSSADWSSQFDQLSADVANMRIGMTRLEEFAHQEARWVRTTLTSIVQNMSAASGSASAPPPPPPFEYAPPFAPARPRAGPSRPLGYTPSYAPAPHYAPPPSYSTAGFHEAEDRFAGLDDDDED